ncbi:MAG TPA: NAD-binding protein, partial [Candidatus Thermoplasmatota archaeon]|nr:NAD-binding protein [Candidatus Thermoplasmatota archaeon]
REQRVGKANGGNGGVEGHVVIIGGDATAQRLAERLHERGVPTLIVVPGPPDWTPPASTHVVYGSPDHLEILDEASYRKARLVVSTLAEPGLNEHLLQACSGVVPFACRAESPGLARHLEAQGAAFTIVPSQEAAGIVVEAVLARRPTQA